MGIFNFLKPSTNWGIEGTNFLQSGKNKEAVIYFDKALENINI